MPTATPRVITVALLGAESTGKSQLACALVARLCQAGKQAVAVDEYLREWCALQGRTPQPEEQFEIALQQRLRIEQAVRDMAGSLKPDQQSYVIADTTPLMTAVYSEFIFQDTRLHTTAVSYQRRFDATLVTGLDMPWQADGLQRDGEHVRAPVDALLRSLLQQNNTPFEVIYGHGEQRLKNAVAAVTRLTNSPSNATDSIAPHADSAGRKDQNALKNWQWNCEKCSDPDCEHRLFTGLPATAPVNGT